MTYEVNAELERFLFSFLSCAIEMGTIRPWEHWTLEEQICKTGEHKPFYKMICLDFQGQLVFYLSIYRWVTSRNQFIARNSCLKEKKSDCRAPEAATTINILKLHFPTRLAMGKSRCSFNCPHISCLFCCVFFICVAMVSYDQSPATRRHPDTPARLKHIWTKTLTTGYLWARVCSTDLKKK